MTGARVEASLRAVAAPFAAGGLAAPGAPGRPTDDAPVSAGVELRWGPLFAALDGRGDDGFVEASATGSLRVLTRTGA